MTAVRVGFGTAVVLIVIFLIAHVMPNRMPPDPFGDRDPETVILEVHWDGIARSQHIAWDVGDDEGEVNAHPDDHQFLPEEGGWVWTHVTTVVEPGTVMRVSAIQNGGRGPVRCSVYVGNNHEPVAFHATQDPLGCLAEATYAGG